MTTSEKKVWRVELEQGDDSRTERIVIANTIQEAVNLAEEITNPTGYPKSWFALKATLMVRAQADQTNDRLSQRAEYSGT